MNYDKRQSPSTQLESLPLDMCLINSADIINRLSGPLHRQFNIHPNPEGTTRSGTRVVALCFNTPNIVNPMYIHSLADKRLFRGYSKQRGNLQTFSFSIKLCATL
jgi:hypothetical protein